MQTTPALTESLRWMEYYADSVDLIDVGFLTRNIIRYGYGPSQKKPFAPQFNDVMMTFYNDSTSTNLGFFQEWAQIVQGFDMSSGIYEQVPGGGTDDTLIQPYEVFYQDDYAVDGQITLIDVNGADVVTWRMRRMWPLHIPNSKLGWAINNDVQKCTVIFSYTDWYVDVVQGGTLINYYQSQAGANDTRGTNAQQYINSLYNPFNPFQPGVPSSSS